MSRGNFRIVIALAAFVSVLFCSANAKAQNSTASPYSMYGFGLMTPKEDVAAAGLGHSGIALQPSEWLNISNPAGIGNLDSLSFYFNINLKGFYAREEAGMEKASIYSANIDGISMGFRGRRWLAIAFGYAPFSAVGYKLYEYKSIVGTNDEYKVEYKGSGGLSQAYFNAAISPFKHWTVGGNFSVLWGTIEKLESSYFSEVIGGEDIFNKRKYKANNIYWEVGTQFDFNIGENNFRFGAVFAPKIWLHTSYEQTVYNNISNELQFDDSTPDRFKVPRMYGAGFTFTRKKFLGTVECKISEWGDIIDTKFKDRVKFRDTYTVSGGIQYSPGSPDMPFYKRMRYRVGFYYGRDYMDFTNKVSAPVFDQNGNLVSYDGPTKDFSVCNLIQSGFTLGITVPMGRSLNAITIAYEHQHRGTQDNGMIEENINNIKLGINIREIWFMRHKFD